MVNANKGWGLPMDVAVVGFDELFECFVEDVHFGHG
jgi:hypothetical protein